MFSQFIWTVLKVENTEDIKYPEPVLNAINPNEKTTQLAQKSSTGPPTQEQPQHPTFSSSETHSPSRLQNASPAISGHPVSLQITHERNLGPNGQPLETERDQRIAQLTDELALKSALLEQAEAADRLLMQTSLVGRRDVDMQAKLDELVISRDQQVGRYEKELTNVRAKLEAKESELEAVRLRLTDAEMGWTKSKAEADTLRVQTATGSVNRDEDQFARRFMERMQAIEAKVASKG